LSELRAYRSFTHKTHETAHRNGRTKSANISRQKGVFQFAQAITLIDPALRGRYRGLQNACIV
jgi:hypothetical protein